ncbi:MAG TPA: orotidine-5'-phosphate decarboxylase [Longimicrobiaceae bacterium]
MNADSSGHFPSAAAPRAAVPILALDVPSAEEAFALVERVPRADFVKVGLQLFTAEGPAVVRQLRARGRRVFLDLKLHDIPNTVAGAVESAAKLGVDLLTVHASGGEVMLRAAVEAAERALEPPQLLAVTVLTSFSAEGLGQAWGREALDVEREVVRLATLARDAGIPGVVASVREVTPIRAALGHSLRILTPGIRLAGDAPGDQTRIATPAEAVRLGSDYLVIGRTVTAAPDPAAAFDRVLAELEGLSVEARSG